jgi:hypothetical protein
MCEEMLCMQLRRVLVAAFRKENIGKEDPFSTWVSAFMDGLQEIFPAGSHPHRLVGEVADGALQSLFVRCPCEGLVENILWNPKAFLRSVLLMGNLTKSEKERSVPSFTLQ